MSEPRVLRPSGRRTAFRAFLGAVVLVFAIGATTSGAAPIGVPLIAVGAWLWAMTACILFVPRSYELHLDDRGFRVHDIFGRPAHDVVWSELATLVPVLVNASITVVAFVCLARRPKQGRLRWRRGTDHDDGCMPDHYGMKPEALIELMSGFWNRGTSRPTAATPTAGLQAF